MITPPNSDETLDKEIQLLLSNIYQKVPAYVDDEFGHTPTEYVNGYSRNELEAQIKKLLLKAVHFQLEERRAELLYACGVSNNHPWLKNQFEIVEKEIADLKAQLKALEGESK